MDKLHAGAGNNPSYKGYKYQKDVTAWVALNLFGKSAPQLCDTVIVEPASDEDIEAKLNVQPEDVMTTITVSAPVILTIQVKYRGSGYWTSKDFAALIEDKPKKGSRGPAPRTRAKKLLLVEPSRRYLLITNVSVDHGLSEGRVKGVFDAPPQSFLPPGMKKEKESLSGRFSVIESLTEAVIRSDLKRMLENEWHVPSGSVVKVIENLERCIEDRILGLTSPLTRSDVEGIVRRNGGLPQADRELSEYVAPLNLDRARQILNKKDAVLLIGLPGYGKSLTAKKLVLEHRLQNPPFEEVRQPTGLEAIDLHLAAPGRHIFYLDDPWGQSKLEPDASRWSEALPKLLCRATPDKKFVITSRTDILRLASLAVDKDKEFWKVIVCPISRESYDDETRWAVLMIKLHGYEGWRVDFANQHCSRLLRELGSPYSIDRFARGLIETTPDKADITLLIDQAQTETIQRTVEEQVKGWPRHGVACGTILWALLRYRGKITHSRLKALRRMLEKAPMLLPLELEDFVAHLKVMSLKEESDGTLSAHSKVVEALEQVVMRFAVEAERTINKVLLAYERLLQADQSYGQEILQVLSSFTSIQKSEIELEPDVVEMVDSFLLHRLAQADNGDFPAAFHDVARFASDGRPLARLVSYLENGDPGNKRRGFIAIGWRPVKIPPAEIKSIQSDISSEHVVSMFISSVLPHQSELYDAWKLLAWLRPFKFGLALAFQEACKVVAGYPGYLMNGETVFAGAILCADPSQYLGIFSWIEELENRIERHQKKRGVRRPWQGEMDYAEQLHQQDELEGEGTAVPDAVKGYVTARRSREGYAWIMPHRRKDLLIRAWPDAMTWGVPSVTEDEVSAFLKAADTPTLRARGLRILGEKAVVGGDAHLTVALETGSSEEITAAISALLWLKEKPDVEKIIVAVMNKADLVRQVALLLASGELPGKDAVMQALVQKAPPVSKTVLNLVRLAAFDAPFNDLVAAFREVDVKIIELLMENGPRSVARLLLSLSGHEGHDVLKLAARSLKSGEVDDVLAAISALSGIGTSEARALIGTVVGHPDYKVRRAIMQCLAAGGDDQDVRFVLERVADKSGPVREVLASLIEKYRWPQGIPILLRLLRDKRDYSRYPEYYIGWEAEREYKVARTAASALEVFKPFTEDVVKEIIGFLKDRGKASDDVLLHAQLVKLIADAADIRVAETLSELLADHRVIGGRKENLYPVRYAAAWGINFHLWSYPNHQDHVDWTVVEQSARHEDAQLAAPCLCLLGMRLDAPTPGLLSALRDATWEGRTILALIMADSYVKAREYALKFGLLPSNHPFVQDEGATEWLDAKSLEQWLQSIDREKDVARVLLKMASYLLDIDLGVEDFSVTALRRKPHVPVTSLSEMFGME